MKLSTLLQHVPHLNVYQAIHHGSAFDRDITEVLELYDQTSRGDVLRWWNGKGPHPEDVNGVILVKQDDHLFDQADVLVTCISPKLSIMMAIYRMYPLEQRDKLVDISYGVRILSRTWEQIGKPIGGVNIGANAVIGREGFGFLTPESSTQMTAADEPLRFPHIGGVRIGNNVEIGSSTTIDRGAIGDTIIGDNVKIDNLVHIAHNVRIGAGTLIVAGAVIGGSAVIGERCFIGINASIKNKVRIGNDCTIGMGAVVTKDVPDGETWVGNPARKMEKP